MKRRSFLKALGIATAAVGLAPKALPKSIEKEIEHKIKLRRHVHMGTRTNNLVYN